MVIETSHINISIEYVFKYLLLLHISILYLYNKIILIEHGVVNTEKRDIHRN